MSALSCQELRKAYGDIQAVDGFSLEAPAGAIVALLGPSGCGKTTALRMIAGFERPDAGAVRVGGRTLAGPGEFVAPERRRVGVVFQDYALFPHMDVAANVGYGLGRKPDREAVTRALALVGLSDEASRSVHELSGGQQQRVALARALAPTPDLVLLDEPFSNLDASLRDRLRQEVRAILLEAGVTALFVTHDQEEALSLAETVAVMRDGRIEQIGSPEAVYSRPKSRWMAEFVGEIEVLPGEARGGRAECELGSLPADTAASGPVDVLVRPESLAVGLHGPQAAAPAEVVSRRFFGHDQLVELRLPSGQVIRSRRLGFPPWHPGDHVQVWLDGPADVLPRESRSQDGCTNVRPSPNSAPVK